MKYFGCFVILLSSLSFSQQPSSPAMSTADRVAIQKFEKDKQDANKLFNDAQQGELSVLREWQESHPGWHINPQTFVIEPDPTPAKVPEKPAEPEKK